MQDISNKIMTPSSYGHVRSTFPHPVTTCSKLTTETLEQDAKYVQS